MQSVTRIRLNAFVFGTLTAGVAYVYTQRLIFRSTARVCESFPSKPDTIDVKEEIKIDPLFGASFRNACIRRWNKGIDFVFGGLATQLAKHGL